MTLSNESIQKIVEKAAKSPSGDNCQPWTFEWDGQYLRIFYSHERGLHPLNVANLASFITLGTLLTAIDLSASEYKASCEYTLGEMTNQTEKPWALVQFKIDGRSPHPLASTLFNRHTDRRPYKGGTLTAETFKDIFAIQKIFAPLQFHFINQPSQRLVDYISQAESFLFGHYPTLSSTLHWLRYSSSHAQQTRDGMLWKNMQIKLWELPMIPLLRDCSWITKYFGAFLRRKYKLQIKQLLLSSAGLVCVSIPSIQPENIVNTGRMMMLIWLSLVQQGYSVQPLTMSSLITFSINNRLFEVAPKWAPYFDNGDSLLRSEFAIPEGQQPFWMIRTGKMDPFPQELNTYRLPIEQILKFRN